MDSALLALVHILTWTFVIGAVGCVLVIPIVAIRLFGVLFEPDRPGEE